MAAQPCVPGTRYLQQVFPQITKHSNVTYATNVPSVGPVYISEAITQNIDLRMDIYEPVGDTLTKRPLVILAYGGGFIIGSKEDEDINSVCDSLAHMGYVAAVINYRMGVSVVEAAGAERTIYRAGQDFSAAVRYLKHHATTYGIDTNLVFAGGVSAGGFAAMSMAFMDEADRPASTYAAGGLTPRADLGCTTCTGNSYTASDRVAGLINYWGALGNPAWIKAGNAVPFLAFHGDIDLIVPYNQGLPFTALATMPIVYGSLPLGQRMDQLGMYNQVNIYPGVGHNIWGLVVLNNFSPGPTQYYRPIFDKSVRFLYQLIKPAQPLLSGDTTVCVQAAINYEVDNANPSATYCWDAPDGTVVPMPNGRVQVSWPVAGYYPVVVRELSQNLVLSEPDTLWVEVFNPIIGAVFTSGDVCPGEPAILTFVGDLDVQWQIPALGNPTNPTITITTDTNNSYTVLATDSNGCQSTYTANVSVFPAQQAPDVIQVGDTLFANGDTVKWFQNGVALPLTRAWITPLAADTFWYESVDVNGCLSKSAPFGYQVLETGVSNASIAPMLVYPNPFEGTLQVNLPVDATFSLTDVAGRTVMRTKLTAGKHLLLLPETHAGVCFYQIKSEQGIRQTGKLIRQ